ncbi:MAG: sulfur carrier protein ThiS adenylyltransferase ThiF [Bacteroidales bacterium]|nr:sulfur carrier protein ThiS adenylyltransferase ThiF [Bacteroidales bacterium]MDD3961191.1 sulfur carrier protein ThiS adenylyltransferase ThiF [Bacteroidales bacterium]MDY0284615.1 sulfur carrier protein ThiS adenylyltransferase ThiF [Bacteroidales bacterium]HPE85758.1 sulfur carrier protein ThiS adenylyltransferase ThiF [Bacteroidales bacterium]
MNDALRAHLVKKVVGIAGVGGLGSNCAVSLARIGVGKIIISDFDVVTRGNLNRQYFFEEQIGILKVKALKMNIFRIDPHIRVIAHAEKVTPENVAKLFDEAEVLIEAMDLAREKQVFIETALGLWPDKPIVAGNGVAGWGFNEALTTMKYGNLYICGDAVSEVSEELPPLAPRVSIVANMQANQALDLLMADFDLSMYTME